MVNIDNINLITTATRLIIGQIQWLGCGTEGTTNTMAIRAGFLAAGFKVALVSIGGVLGAARGTGVSGISSIKGERGAPDSILASSS